MVDEERMQILKMIEQGNISAAEGERLLLALESRGAEQEGSAESPQNTRPRWFRVRITDLQTKRQKVNINIPIGLVHVGFRMGARFIPDLDQTHYNQLLHDAQAGHRGRLLEHTDSLTHEYTELFIE